MVRQVSSQVLAHLHHMDLRWHLDRKTGSLQRVVDRGTRGITFLLSSMVFNVVPTIFEVSLVSALLAHNCGWQFAALTAGTIGVRCPRDPHLRFNRRRARDQ